MKQFAKFILCFALIGLWCNARADETPEGDFMREVLIRLAEDGSEESYREIERMLAGVTFDHPLFASEVEFPDGYFEGKKAVDTALTIIGDRGDESSYRFLSKLMRDNFEKSDNLNGIMWDFILSNLLKYRETKSEELVDLIGDAIEANYEMSELLLKDYPLVGQEGIYYTFSTSDYINEAGEVVYETSVNKGARYSKLIDSLNVIGSREAYELMLEFFQSWVGRESSTLVRLPQIDFRKKRYDPNIISIYDTLFRDVRHHPGTRNAIINAFFSNKPDLFLSFTNVDNPKEFFPQLDELDQGRLLRILALADYALSRDFLPQETVDLIQSKRAEILKLLSAMGYEHEAATTDETVEEVAEAEQETQKPIKMGEPEPTEEPAEQSSNWWLWLIGLLVVVGGLAVVVRRKS